MTWSNKKELERVWLPGFVPENLIDRGTASLMDLFIHKDRQGGHLDLFLFLRLIVLGIEARP